RQRPRLAQKVQQFDQRQPLDRELVSLDRREELRAGSFEPVRADRRQQRFALSREISVKKGVAEIAHRQYRLAGAPPHDLAGYTDADRRREAMGSAPQRRELVSRRRQVGGLVVPLGAAGQNLVTADYQRVR